MNRDMLMAGLKHYTNPRFDPDQTVFVYTTPTVGAPNGPVDRRADGVQWHEVAAAALARIEALERAEWFVKLPEHEMYRYLQDTARREQHLFLESQRLTQLNATQAETIRRLQKELDDVKGAIRV